MYGAAGGLCRQVEIGMFEWSGQVVSESEATSAQSRNEESLRFQSESATKCIEQDFQN